MQDNDVAASSFYFFECSFVFEFCYHEADFAFAPWEVFADVSLGDASVVFCDECDELLKVFFCFCLDVVLVVVFRDEAAFDPEEVEDDAEESCKADVNEG